MLIYKEENLVHSAAPIIVHGCNAQGKMNSGVAKAIRNRFPEAYKDYMNMYSSAGLQTGKNIYTNVEDKLIVSAITQEYYGYDGKQYVSYHALKLCLEALDFYIQRNDYNNPTIAMPKIGCGLGGGDWDIVKTIVETALKSYTIEVCYLD